MTGARNHGAPAFDAAAALELAGGDRALRDELLQLVVEHAPVALQEAIESLERGDLFAVERAAHRLKGSLRTIAAGESASASAALEQAARAGTLKGAAAEILGMQSAVFALIAQIRLALAAHAA